jgi:hypothetical protein
LAYQGDCLTDVHTGNVGVSERSFKAGQYVVHDIGQVESSRGLYTLPGELEGGIFRAGRVFE